MATARQRLANPNKRREEHFIWKTSRFLHDDTELGHLTVYLDARWVGTRADAGASKKFFNSPALRPLHSNTGTLSVAARAVSFSLIPELVRD